MKSVVRVLFFHVFVFVVLCAPAVAQEELFVPECEACPEFSTPPYPHSGWWSNPFESGTGINLDVQDGVVAGNFFVYAEDGSPVWYQFSGSLEQGGDADIYWTLTNDLYAYSGGQTLKGEYSEPDHEVVGTIAVEFVRRNLLRFQVDDGPVRTMTSYMFGAWSDFYFEPDSNIPAPSFKESNPIIQVRRDAPWIVSHMKPEIGHAGFASVGQEPHWGITQSEPGDNKRTSYSIKFVQIPTIPATRDSGQLDCGTGEQLRELYSSLSDTFSNEKHFCLARIGPPAPDGEMKTYFIRIGDITDRGFIGVSEDGWIIEGIRLLYN